MLAPTKGNWDKKNSFPLPSQGVMVVWSVRSNGLPPVRDWNRNKTNVITLLTTHCAALLVNMWAVVSLFIQK